MNTQNDGRREEGMVAIRKEVERKEGSRKQWEVTQFVSEKLVTDLSSMIDTGFAHSSKDLFTMFLLL